MASAIGLGNATGNSMIDIAANSSLIVSTGTAQHSTASSMGYNGGSNNTINVRTGGMFDSGLLSFYVGVNGTGNTVNVIGNLLLALATSGIGVDFQAVPARASKVIVWDALAMVNVLDSVTELNRSLTA